MATTPNLTRRRFLSALAAGGAGMGLAPTLLAAVQRAWAVEPAAGTTWEDAEHVVFLMQENRSFDHAFGSLQGVRGFNDPRALTLPGGLPVWCQADDAGGVHTPFRLDVGATRAAWMGDNPHSWTDQVDARNGGRHDRWLPVKTRKGRPPQTLGYYTRADVPFHYALADAFTICDQHFCSTLTGTTTNRLHFFSGTCREAQDPAARLHLYNEESDHSGILEWTSFPERLTRLGVPWKVYQNQLSVATGLGEDETPWLGNFGLNVLEFFAPYRVRFATGHHPHLARQAEELPAQIARAAAASAAKPADRALADEVAGLRKRLERVRADLVAWHPDRFADLTEEQRALHRQAFVTNPGPASRAIARPRTTLPDGTAAEVVAPQGDVLAQFRADAAAGALPAVSWLAAPRNFSDHPAAPWYGAWFTSEVLSVLSADPERWRKTILVVTYDENDGYFDHHAPFVAPRMGDPASGACSAGVDSALEWTTRDRASPIGLGYRVPMIVASPWTRGGWVDSQVCDHTSSLRLLERFVQRRFGKAVREDNISSWRRTIAGDLTSVFRPAQAGAPPGTPAFLDQRAWMATIARARKLPPPDPGQPLSAAELAQVRSDPAASPRLPRQEPGTRPATPLPYDLMADGALDEGRQALRLDLQVLTRLFGPATAGCPFQVVAPGRVAAAAQPASGERAWQEVRTWDYAVAAGGRLAAAFPLADFPDARYHLRVNGPNGFLRELRGSAADPLLAIAADTEVDAAGAPTGNLRLTLRAGAAPAALSVRIVPNGYGLPASDRPLAAGAATTVSLPLERSHGWYDVTVLVDGSPDFAQRYAGRIETGRPSRTDPVMGREPAG